MVNKVEIEWFKTMEDSKINAIVVGECYGIAQRMCRRSMIRNGYWMNWFQALVQNECF